jgi:3-oxocholest-4-en-26-oate---CoA ligase
MPKGVLWRQADIHRTAMGGRNLLTREPWPSLEAIADTAAQDPAPNVVLPAAPFMHGAGHWTAFMAMNLGWTVVVPNEVTRLDPTDLCRVLERERVTYLQLIGDAFARPLVEEIETCRYDLSSLRTVLSGGVSFSPAVKARLLDRLPQIALVESIGSSEGGSQALQRATAGDVLSSATFAPVEGTVVVSADRQRILAPGDDEIGWMAKRGHDIPIGYLGDPEKTAQTFPVVSGERMSLPGDRARWLNDGTIDLLGRDSVTINSGGEKIFVEEVEAAIVAHPDVDDVIVTSRPSERWGQETVAIVQLREGANATQADLATEANRHIARYKLPKAWVFVDGIERTAAGKADYRWAQALARDAS